MTDIVERLRESATGKPGEWRSGPSMLLHEAADEIKRLAAENVKLNDLLMDCHAEIDRLREVVVAGDREIKASHADCDRYRAGIERLRAALLSCPCPSGGWNGMPTGIEATVAACVKNKVCGCDLGRALGDEPPPPGAIKELTATVEWQPRHRAQFRQSDRRARLEAQPAAGGVAAFGLGFFRAHQREFAFAGHGYAPIWVSIIHIMLTYLHMIFRCPSTTEEKPMLKLVAATFALLILGESIALAACPPGTRYTCSQGWNGKVICSCS